MRFALAAVLASFVMADDSNAGSIESVSFHSDVLNRDYSYLVYLPEGYDVDRKAPYPTVYLLHGSFVTAEMWTEGLGVEQKLDALIRNDDIPPTVIVMPNSESWWIDGRNEAAETAFFNELVPHVEKRWHVSDARKDRFVGGISAGGFGTVNFVLKRPEMFAAGVALSPASYEDLPPEDSSSYQHPAFVDDKGDFDSALWRSVNYPALIDQYRAQDIVVPLYINSGDHDYLDIAYHAAVLYQKLRDHQPEHVELRIIDGDHELDVWDTTFDEAMQFMLQTR
ncbi:MAG: alpha/beta hydrolase-fold protein [Pseudomonadota bacterium]